MVPADLICGEPLQCVLNPQVLTPLIAETASAGKDPMIRVIVNLLVETSG